MAARSASTWPASTDPPLAEETVPEARRIDEIRFSAWVRATLWLVAVPLGYMVAVGETLVGIALLVGLFTRFAAFWTARASTPG